MAPELYSIDQVADLLQLHVKTVRNYVRVGRLRARRIGKQYRIAKEDIEALLGRPVVEFDPNAVSSHGRVCVSTVVRIEALSRGAADRLTTLLMGAVRAERRDEEPVRLESMYDQERNELKVVVFGGPRWSASLLELISQVVETGNAQ